MHRKANSYIITQLRHYTILVHGFLVLLYEYGWTYVNKFIVHVYIYIYIHIYKHTFIYIYSHIYNMFTKYMDTIYNVCAICSYTHIFI